MDRKQTRRHFMKCCAAAGGFGCMLPAWSKGLTLEDGSSAKNDKPKDHIDLKKLSYCGIRCEEQCELYKATKDNDVKLKEKIYDEWKWKEKFRIEFDPEKVFCHTCKPDDRPLKIGMDQCGVRKCATGNGMESCVQCKSLPSCGDVFWKNWPELHEQVVKMQAQYLAQSKSRLMKAKKTDD
jgi:hypothetical protein